LSINYKKPKKSPLSPEKFFIVYLVFSTLIAVLAIKAPEIRIVRRYPDLFDVFLVISTLYTSLIMVSLNKKYYFEPLAKGIVYTIFFFCFVGSLNTLSLFLSSCSQFSQETSSDTLFKVLFVDHNHIMSIILMTFIATLIFVVLFLLLNMKKR
jgi:hypothetical protein